MPIKDKTSPNSFSEYCASTNIKSIKQDKSILIKKIKPQVIRLINPNNNKANSYNLLEDQPYQNSHYKDGQKQTIKKLQREYQIRKTLDLHNFIQSEAILTLETFINDNITPANTCLKIIHGKGLNSPDGNSVLKALVRRFLEHHPRVLGYTNALEKDGGDGATLIKLRNKF